MEVNTDNLGNFEEFSAVFGRLTKDQLRVVVAMQECNSKKAAADKLEIPVKTVYGWGQVIDDAVKLLALDIIESSRQMRKSALARAIAVKIAGLDSKDEKVRQSAATEIIEAELGKPTQGVDLTSKGEALSNIVQIIEHGEPS